MTPQVLVRFKTGDHAVFDLGGREEYFALGAQLARWFNCWIYIGQNALVKKDDIDRLFYFPEGYAKSSKSDMPQN